MSQGGRQIEHEEQDPRVHRKYLNALRVTGVASVMGDVFGEEAILGPEREQLTGIIQSPHTAGPPI